MRRAVAPLLLALTIISPLLAQSAARRDGATRETTRYSRLYVFGDSYSTSAPGTSTATAQRQLRISAG